MKLPASLSEDMFFSRRQEPLEILPGLPALRIETECFIKNPGPEDGQGGVFDSEGAFIRGSGLQRGKAQIVTGKRIAPGAETRVEETHLYIGVLYLHFGHCLLEGLARIWPLLSGAIPRDTPLAVMEHPNRDPRMLKAWLALLGFPDQRITFVNSVTAFSELIIPDPGIVISKHGFPGHVQSLQQAFLGACREAQESKPRSGAVYLSRSKLSPDKRIIIGEQHIESYLSSCGVDIMYPETLALRDQIHALRGYETVIGYVGSAFHNLFFCEPGVNAIYLCANPPIKTYHIIDEMLGINGVFVNDSKAGGIDGFSYVHLHNEPILPDFTKLFDFFESIGFSGERPKRDDKQLLAEFMGHWQRNVCQTLFGKLNQTTTRAQKESMKTKIPKLTQALENNIRLMAERLISSNT